LRDPHGALGALGDVGHAVSQRGGRAAREEVGGKPAKVQVAIGGDALVVHTSSRVGGGHARPGRPSRPGAGSVEIIWDRCQTKAGTGSICFAILPCERPGNPQRTPSYASGCPGARASSRSQLAPVPEAKLTRYAMAAARIGLAQPG